MNIRGLWELDDVVDVNRIASNDIRAILETYGVEAARSTIMKEIAKVFDVYGISVDLRHLSLIADYMVGKTKKQKNKTKKQKKKKTKKRERERERKEKKEKRKKKRKEKEKRSIKVSVSGGYIFSFQKHRPIF